MSAEGRPSGNRVDGMDVRARLRAEYALLLAEADELFRFMHASDADGGEPADPVRTDILCRQLDALMEYLRILAERAALEGVFLDFGKGTPTGSSSDSSPAYNRSVGGDARRGKDAPMKDIEDSKDVGAKDLAEALKAVEARLASVETMLWEAKRLLMFVEAWTGPEDTWGESPADACGNPVPHR